MSAGRNAQGYAMLAVLHGSVVHVGPVDVALCGVKVGYLVKFRDVPRAILVHSPVACTMDAAIAIARKAVNRPDLTGTVEARRVG
jgi:hypothetical protein